jgi:hypothetical protein
VQLGVDAARSREALTLQPIATQGFTQNQENMIEVEHCFNVKPKDVHEVQKNGAVRV